MSKPPSTTEPHAPYLGTSPRDRFWDRILIQIHALVGRQGARLDVDLDRLYISYGADPVMILTRTGDGLVVSIRASSDQIAVAALVAQISVVSSPLVFDAYFEYDDHGMLLLGSNAIVWASRRYPRVLRERFPESFERANEDRLEIGMFDLPPLVGKS